MDPQGPSFLFFFPLYFAELSTTKIQYKSVSIESGLPGVLVLIFEWEPMCYMVEHEVKSRKVNRELAREVW